MTEESIWTPEFLALVAEVKPVFMDIRDRFVAALDSSGKVHVFDAASRRLLHACAAPEPATACGLSLRHAVLGLQDAAEQRTLQDDLSDGQLCRFSAHVTCVGVGASGRLVAVGAADFSAKVVELEADCVVGERRFVGHSAPLLSASLDPSERLLATSACDGSARVWDAESGSCLRTWRVQTACSDKSQSVSACPLLWRPPAGDVLAVPAGRELRLHTAAGWAQLGVCASDRLSGSVRCASWRPDGRQLAAADSVGGVCAWTVQLSPDAAAASCRLQSAARHPALCAVSQLWWLAADRLLCLDVGAGLRPLELRPNCGQKQQQRKEQKEKEVEKEEEVVDAEAELDGVDAKDLVEEFETQLLEEQEAEDGAGFVDDDGDDAAKAEGEEEEEEGDGDGEGDDAGSEARRDGEESSDIARIKSAFRRDASPQLHAQLQRPLQSGSTSGSPRFLVCNSVGCVIESPAPMPGQPPVLSVEFHDSALHHSLLIPNSDGCTLAGLSSRVLALAAPSTEEVLSFVRARPLSQSQDKEWSLALPKGEDAVCLSASDCLVAVGTDRRCVRVLSVHGLQLGLVCSQGPLVSLCACDTALAAVWHSGAPLPGDQSLCADVFDASPRLRLRAAALRLPLTARSALAWIGFCSDTAALCAQDTYGTVRALMPDCSWLPVCSARQAVKERTDWLWPVFVRLRQRQLCAVHCRNSSQPPTQPRPSLQFFPLQLPLCDSGLQDLESQLLLSDAKSLPELLLRLFAQSVKADEEAKALDAADLMPAKVVQLALQYAGKARRQKLAERLSDRLRRPGAAGDQQQQQQQQQQSAAAPISPIATSGHQLPAAKRRKRELDTL